MRSMAQIESFDIAFFHTEPDLCRLLQTHAESTSPEKTIGGDNVITRGKPIDLSIQMTSRPPTIYLSVCRQFSPATQIA